MTIITTTGHDLLFDSGLQFRPTASRRKRDVVEGYWAAIERELENGCTCASFNFANQPCPLVCACAQFPVAPTQPLLTMPSHERVMTVRMPSRVPPLLAELLAILLSVIEPLPSATPGVYMQKPTGSPQGQRLQADHHATQASMLHDVLDPGFIKQEVDHGLFDPRGMFRVIGETLKYHCAPMRDGAVEAMVAVGQTCAPGAGGTYASAVQAMRMCFEVLEFMKLVRGCSGLFICLALLSSAAHFHCSPFLSTVILGHCKSPTSDTPTVPGTDLARV